jgi:hypothetical protein
MTEKHDHQFTVKLTDSQHAALMIQSELTGDAPADIVRSFIDGLLEKQALTYRLLQSRFKHTENLNDFVNKVNQGGVK